MSGHRIFTTSFASVYPLYVQKAVRKGRSAEEVDQVTCWLTGYSPQGLRDPIDQKVDFSTFFAQAPALPAVGSKEAQVHPGHQASHQGCGGVRGQPRVLQQGGEQREAQRHQAHGHRQRAMQRRIAMHLSGQHARHHCQRRAPRHGLVQEVLIGAAHEEHEAQAVHEQASSEQRHGIGGQDGAGGAVGADGVAGGQGNAAASGGGASQHQR
jgi:hypothetical protein